MRKIAVFTGNRAEYGLQYPIIKGIYEHPDLECYLLASGAHLQEDFGTTKGEIEKDGFHVHAEIELEMKDDTLRSTCTAIGSGILNISEVIEEIQPDFFVVYADRFEGLAAVVASSQMNIPTVHIEGGDVTEGGALDDSVRHAMTKLSHLHFTTNEDARERILRLGEEEWRVHNVGFPVIDLLADGKYASEAELAERYGLAPDQPVLLFTQHSVTTESNSAIEQIQPSLSAMRRLADEGCQVILTYPNNDAGGKRIIAELQRFCSEAHPRIQLHKSLGRYNYHGVLALCGSKSGACVGNSSSGIKETPYFGCPTINIGSRQDGRLRAENVIDAGYDETEIYEQCKRALSDEPFRKQCRECKNPYGKGGAGKAIAEMLADIELKPSFTQKKITY